MKEGNRVSAGWREERSFSGMNEKVKILDFVSYFQLF